MYKYKLTLEELRLIDIGYFADSYRKKCWRCGHTQFRIQAPMNESECNCDCHRIGYKQYRNVQKLKGK